MKNIIFCVLELQTFEKRSKEISECKNARDAIQQELNNLEEKNKSNMTYFL